MEPITMNDGTELEVNTSAVEPNEYFKILKSKIQNASQEKLKSQLDVIGEQLIYARNIGQQKFLEQLSFTWDTILKEQILLSYGISEYVYKDDIKYFLDNVTPKNSIKIIELERYPRAIPLDVLKEIDEVKNKNIFDHYCVVFTDFTDNTYQSDEDKETISRNKDPIVFGYFKQNETGIKHDRFYYIADWVDEHCDLTFTKMIEKMSELHMATPSKTISTDSSYLQEIVNNTLSEIKIKHNIKNRNQFVSMAEEPKSWFKRIFGK